MPRGLKKAGSSEPLPPLEVDHGHGPERFTAWCRRFLTVPRGHGAGEPLTVHPFQLRMLSGVLGGAPKRHSVVVAPRGMSKSTTMAALALYLAFDQPVPGGFIPLIGPTEAGSFRLLATVKRFVESSSELAERVTLYRDRLIIPASGTEIVAMPPTVTAVEGSDIAPLAIVDEIGFIPSDVYESALLSCGKRPNTGILAIGTPCQPKYVDTTPLRGLIDAARAGDPDIHYVEFAATHCDDWSCLDCLREAYDGAIGTVIALDDLRASMPPKVSEAEFRRTRRAEWVQNTAESFIPADSWDLLGDPDGSISDGADVVIGVDGSISGDATALVLASVADEPRFELLGLWEKRRDDADSWRVPLLDVEQAIRAACRRYRVREVAADPAHFERTLQVLHAEGLPISRFPFTGSRAKSAAADYRGAVLAGLLSHSGDPDMRRHHTNAILAPSGLPEKTSRKSKRHIDVLAAAIIAHSRASWLARKRTGRVMSIRRKR